MHNSSRRALAGEMRCDGLVALEEFTAPSLTVKEADGSLTDGIADIAVRPLWAAQHTFLDITFATTSAAKHKHMRVQEAIKDAAQRKIVRYKGAMLPLAFSDRGKPDPAAIETLYHLPAQQPPKPQIRQAES